MDSQDQNGKDIDLRPLIARLKDIERKCDSMGTRNEEFPLMKDKLASIIARLEAGEDDDGEPLPFRAMARELFPVAHLFESVGFMSVGKEIAHVERSLQDLEPEPVSTSGGGPQPRTSSTSSAATPPQADSAGEHELERNGDEDGEEKDGVPLPILAGVFVLAIAIAVAAAIIFEVGPFQPKPDPTPIPPTPTALPTATPEPPPTPVPRDPNAPPTSRERLAEARSQARLALREGDLDLALNSLSIAALIDRNDSSVIEIAEQIVYQRLAEANEAAADSRWHDAATITSHARSIATRFGLDTGHIDDAEARHADMERVRTIRPDEFDELGAAIGKRVEIKLEDGSVIEGRIARVQRSILVLDVEDDVGGGVVKFEDDIPLATIRWIRVWED